MRCGPFDIGVKLIGKTLRFSLLAAFLVVLRMLPCPFLGLWLNLGCAYVFIRKGGALTGAAYMHLLEGMALFFTGRSSKEKVRTKITAQLAKMSVDPKFVELTADVLEIFL